MSTFMTIALVAAMALTVAMLAGGLINLARGGGADSSKRSNLFMRYRLLFQGAAVLIFVLLLAFGGG